MKIRKMLVLVIFIFLLITSNYLFAQNQYKITYYSFKNKSTTDNYQFLADALPRSIRTVLTREGFGETNKGSTNIENLSDRESILNIGQQLNTDLILVGNYSIVGHGTSSKVQLVIYVYDIKGKERVIEKLVIGGTGTGIFVLIDETAAIIKNAVLTYYKKRDQIIEEARKRRLELAQLAEEERKRKEQARLELNKVKTRYNNSMYLDSHVADAKQFKLFYYNVYEYLEYDTYLEDNYQFNVSTPSIINNLTLSIGLGKNIELGIEQIIKIAHLQDTLGGVYDGKSNKYGLMFNPVLFMKWRFLQNENHGLNTTFKFGLQLGLADKFFAGTIYQPIYISSAHSFHFVFSIDKTWGKFTPYITLHFTIMKRFKGIDNSNIFVDNWEITGFGNSSNTLMFSFNSKIGFEYRPIQWLIIQPQFAFGYLSRKYTELDPVSSIMMAQEMERTYCFTPSINFIFEVYKNTAISLSFSYTFIPNFMTTAYIPPSIKQNLEIRFKRNLRIYLYFAWAVNLQ